MADRGLHSARSEGVGHRGEILCAGLCCASVRDPQARSCEGSRRDQAHLRTEGFILDFGGYHPLYEPVLASRRIFERV